MVSEDTGEDIIMLTWKKNSPYWAVLHTELFGGKSLAVKSLSVKAKTSQQTNPEQIF